jgi:sugar lactone lactonase YvrE
VPGASVVVSGVHLPLGADGPPHVLVGPHDAHVVAASRQFLRVVVPSQSEGGTTSIRIDELPGETAYIEVARVLATGVHQVDSPVFDRLGRLYATQSGSRDTKAPNPLFRVSPEGVREPLLAEIANPTALAVGPDGGLFVSSRFDGHVYRIGHDDNSELYASELGVPTGLAVAADGTLFVGDRSGSILRVSPGKKVETFASLPASVAAFHLAFGPDGNLYVTAPTLASHDPIYRITPDRLVDVVADGFGRPQGLAFDSTGALYVVDALAGAAGLYKVDITRPRPEPELVLSSPALIGVAFDPAGGVVLASNDTLWRLEVGVKPLLGST